MAKGNTTVKLDTRAFEAALKKMKRKEAESVLYKAVSSGARIAKNEVKQNTPISNDGAKGFKLSSRNHESGTLRDSVKFSLKKRARARSAFFGALFLEEDGKKKFYGKFVVNTHNPNAFGYKGGNNFFEKAVKSAENKSIERMEKNLINRFTKYYQRFL